MSLAIETPGCSVTPEPYSPLFKTLAQRLRVLVVEDDQDTRDMLRITLECLGYVVLTARDGESGLRMVEREHPDVFISDIRMPRMDGYAMIERIRTNPELEPIPGIALTGFGLRSEVRRALAAGFDAHVIKPADVDKLSALLQRLATHGRPRPSEPS